LCCNGLNHRFMTVYAAITAVSGLKMVVSVQVSGQRQDIAARGPGRLIIGGRLRRPPARVGIRRRDARPR
jgi:hypothetical protein